MFVYISDGSPATTASGHHPWPHRRPPQQISPGAPILRPPPRHGRDEAISALHAKRGLALRERSAHASANAQRDDSRELNSPHYDFFCSACRAYRLCIDISSCAIRRPIDTLTLPDTVAPARCLALLAPRPDAAPAARATTPHRPMEHRLKLALRCNASGGEIRTQSSRQHSICPNGSHLSCNIQISASVLA
jgi:hypothetical protein